MSMMQLKSKEIVEFANIREQTIDLFINVNKLIRKIFVLMFFRKEFKDVRDRGDIIFNQMHSTIIT